MGGSGKNHLPFSRLRSLLLTNRRPARAESSFSRPGHSRSLQLTSGSPSLQQVASGAVVLMLGWQAGGRVKLGGFHGPRLSTSPTVGTNPVCPHAPIPSTPVASPEGGSHTSHTRCLLCRRRVACALRLEARCQPSPSRFLFPLGEKE